MRLGAQSLFQRGRQAGLANPRLPRQHHRLAFSCASLLPALKQKLEFLGSPHQRRRDGVQRIEASLGISLAGDAPGGNRGGEALELLKTEVDHLEQPCNQPLRAVSDHDGAWLGKGLQASRGVRRVADHGLFLR